MLKKIAVLLTLIALPILYLAPAWLGGVALVQGDGWTANLGLRILTGRMLSEGQLPLWNPYIFAGMPLLASIYPGALYPFNWIFALISPGLAMQIVVITTYHIALTGAYFYARSLGTNRLGAVATGIIFAFGGYMVMSMGQTSNIATAAWLPWILLSIERLSQSEVWTSRWRWVTLGAIAIGMLFFAGVPQIAWYTALVSGAYTVFILATRAHRRPFLIGAVAMSACGLLLSAVQLLPLRELTLQSARAAISYDTFSSYSFPPRQLFALVFPYFFGGSGMPPYRVPYWGEGGIYVTCGYTGLLALLLAVAALVRPHRRVVWFWVAVAGMSLVLSWGGHLPFGLNHWLHAVPVHNLFRASFRHMFEFTFAVAVLAGLGLSKVSQLEKRDARRVALLGGAVLTGMVAVTGCAYLFIDRWMPGVPAGSNSMTNPEAWVPCLFLALSVAAMFGYAHFRTPVWGIAVVLVLFCDLAAFGQFLDWRTLKFSVNEQLRADPPTVQFIKARESSPHTFRILSHSSAPYGTNYQLLNFPNLSIARGLQSVNGYDMLKMARPAEMMGEMTADGVVLRLGSLGPTDQAFNLLNVKYLLWEKSGLADLLTFGGVQFSGSPLDLGLSPGRRVHFDFPDVEANELVIVSNLGNAGGVEEGTPVVRVSIYAKDGRRFEREIQAGRDTSEWAYDRSDLQGSIKHSRAEVAESWSVEGFDGHRYLGRIGFDRAQIERIELDCVLQDAQIAIVRASLYDSSSGRSSPVDHRPLPPERWRKLATFGAVDVYENQQVMPRAWFVNRVSFIPESRVLHWIQRDAGGARFDPLEVALLAPEDAQDPSLTLLSGGKDAAAAATITRYEPNRIELETRTDRAGFLVLSEMHYPGWQARIDGERTKIYRANYVLRGIIAPAGEHRVEFTFRSPSLRLGAVLSGFGMTLLLIGGLVVRFYRDRARE